MSEHGGEFRVEAALKNVARDFAASAKGAAHRAAASGAPERCGYVVAVFIGMEPAEGGRPKTREAAAATRAGEMMAACIIFAAANSGLGPRFEGVAGKPIRNHHYPSFCVSA
ncbi:MAG TPA: hypothetical protein VFO34_03505 [Candidatus Acidoferrales bacterium]|nr:hypothetical protein [Candidatus Acidoferrales bacterium]